MRMGLTSRIIHDEGIELMVTVAHLSACPPLRTLVSRSHPILIVMHSDFIIVLSAGTSRPFKLVRTILRGYTSLDGASLDLLQWGNPDVVVEGGVESRHGATSGASPLDAMFSFEMAVPSRFELAEGQGRQGRWEDACYFGSVSAIFVCRE
jgi:hypothetical protein